MVMEFFSFVWEVYMNMVSGIHNSPDISWFWAFFLYFGVTAVAVIAAFAPVMIALGIIAFLVKVTVALAPVIFLGWIFFLSPWAKDMERQKTLEAATQISSPVRAASAKSAAKPAKAAMSDEQRVAMELELEDIRVEKEAAAEELRYQEELKERHRQVTNELTLKTQQAINQLEEKVQEEIREEKKEREKLRMQIMADCQMAPQTCSDPFFYKKLVHRTSRSLMKDGEWSWLPGREITVSGKVVSPTLKYPL